MHLKIGFFFPAMGAHCVQKQPHQRSATPRDDMHLQKTKTGCMLPQP